MKKIIELLLGSQIVLVPTFTDIEQIQTIAVEQELTLFYNYSACSRPSADVPLYIYGGQLHEQEKRTCLFLDTACPEGYEQYTSKQLQEMVRSLCNGGDGE